MNHVQFVVVFVFVYFWRGRALSVVLCGIFLVILLIPFLSTVYVNCIHYYIGIDVTNT